MTSEVNWDPQSASISSGTQTLLEIIIRSVSILGNATASGYRVAQSIIVSIYHIFLSDPHSIGRTMSTVTLLNGVSVNSNFPNGTLVYTPLLNCPLTNALRPTKP